MDKSYTERLKEKEAEIEAQRTKNTIDLGKAEDDLTEPVAKKQPTSLSEDTAIAQATGRRTIGAGLVLAAILLTLVLFLPGKAKKNGAPSPAQVPAGQPVAVQEAEDDTAATTGKEEQEELQTAPRLTEAEKEVLEQELRRFLTNWQAAWQLSAGKDSDLATYVYFYSDTFTSGTLDKESWMRTKARRNRNKEWIEVTISDLSMEIGEDGRSASLRFKQEYASPNYSDTTNKLLTVAKEIGEWRIVSEMSLR